LISGQTKMEAAFQVAEVAAEQGRRY